ncbi:hypothetical protein [Burkholderia arboris]
MNPDVRARFETEFAPRIATRLLGLYQPGDVKVDVVPHDGQGSPTCVEVVGLTSTAGLPNRLNAARVARRRDRRSAGRTRPQPLRPLSCGAAGHDRALADGIAGRFQLTDPARPRDPDRRPRFRRVTHVVRCRPPLRR